MRRLHRITITDGEQTVTLLPDIVFTIRPEIVAQTAKMASGITVKDVIGERISLEIPTGWLPADKLLTLRNMIRDSIILTIKYPDIDGDKIGRFYVDQPSYKAFRYGVDGVSVWYGVTLKATGAEVKSI